MAKTGRPYKFGEPMVKREVRLPESLSLRLTQVARERKRDISDVLRDALVREFSSAPVADGEPPLAQQIRQAVAEGLRSNLNLRLSPEERAALTKLGESFGYLHLSHLLEDVAAALLSHDPAEVERFLFGHIDRAVDAVEQEQKGRKRRKAA